MDYIFQLGGLVITAMEGEAALFTDFNVQKHLASTGT